VELEFLERQSLELPDQVLLLSRRDESLRVPEAGRKMRWLSKEIRLAHVDGM
jgi:hypothetical protein